MTPGESSRVDSRVRGNDVVGCCASWVIGRRIGQRKAYGNSNNHGNNNGVGNGDVTSDCHNRLCAPRSVILANAGIHARDGA